MDQLLVPSKFWTLLGAVTQVSDKYSVLYKITTVTWWFRSEPHTHRSYHRDHFGDFGYVYHIIFNQTKLGINFNSTPEQIYSILKYVL